MISKDEINDEKSSGTENTETISVEEGKQTSESTSNGLLDQENAETEDQENAKTDEQESQALSEGKDSVSENHDNKEKDSEKDENTEEEGSNNESAKTNTKPKTPTRASKRKLQEVETPEVDSSKQEKESELITKLELKIEDDSEGFEGFPASYDSSTLSFGDAHFMDPSSSEKDNPPKSIPESDIMGKGKRARVPNKRYSEIALSNSRKSLGANRPSETEFNEEIRIKEEPVDVPPAAVSSPQLAQPPAAKKTRMSNVADLTDPKFLKPFKHGWKRELVWRSTSSNEKRTGDIYYYTPTGKKVRSMREVSEHIDNRILTTENFTYYKAALGLNDTSKETIRQAKFIKSQSDSPAVKSVHSSTRNASSPLVKNIAKPAAKKIMSPKIMSPKIMSPKIMSPKIMSPKIMSPKIMSPKVESSKSSETKSSAKVTKVKKETSTESPTIKKNNTKVVVKKTPAKATESHKATPKVAETKTAIKAAETKTPVVVTRSSRKGRSANTPVKAEEPMDVESSPSPVRLSPLKTNKPYQPCSIRCEGVQGIIPTLQCRTCLCLYHYECVGVSPHSNAPYVCKNCQDQPANDTEEDEPPPLISPPPLTPINTLKSVSGSVSNVLPKLQRIPREDGGNTPPIQMQPPVLSPITVLPEMPKLTPRPLSAMKQTPQVVMPQLQVAVPQLQVSLPRLQVPPTQLQMPVPQLPMPVPQLQMPVPQLQMPLPHLQMPVPQLQMPVPQLQMPVPQLQMPLPQLQMPESQSQEHVPQFQMALSQLPEVTTTPTMAHLKTQVVTTTVSQVSDNMTVTRSTHMIRSKTSSASQVLIPQSSQAVLPEGSKSLVGAVTSWLPHNVKIVNSSESTEVHRPQYLEYLNGRKCLIIPKHNLMTVTPSVTRSEEDTVVPSDSTEVPAPTESASMGPVVVPEIKSEPTSPSKPESSPRAETPMDIAEPRESSETGLLDEDDEIARFNNNNKNKKNLRGKKITNTNSINHMEDKPEAKFMENYLQNLSFGYNTLLYVFQYLKVQDLLRAGCVCTMWRDIASHPILWKTVRMKNSQVHSFEGLANTLKSHGTINLDLRKMLLPNSGDEIWPEFSKAIEKVDTLRKIELCRCPASVVEQLAVTNPKLEVINAVTIKCEVMDLETVQNLTNIKELRLKATNGLNISSIDSLKLLKSLKILSLTSVNELHRLNLEVLGELTNLEQLDLGECTDFPKSFGRDILSNLKKLERLRLEKGQGSCHTFEILDAVKNMPRLEQLELVNFDVKSGFDKALGACTNIKKLMIIPTYISQSATTNNMVLSGVLRLQGSLSHFVWGVTLELLRVTELFVDQCEEPKEKKEKKPTGNGDSIPVLKPVPDLTHSKEIPVACNPPQVEILPLPNLQKLLLNSLPTTRVKILKIPFHATWRQTLTDSV